MSNPDARQAAPPERAFLGLELLRFLSAFAVVVWHYQNFFFTPQGSLPPGFSAARQPFYPVLRLFYEIGYNGVIVFWLISGFIFFWKYGASIHARSISARQFFYLRLSRLYPLYLATLLIVAALQWNFQTKFGYHFVYPINDSYHFFLNLLFISGWGFEKSLSFNGPVWSISLEILAYLLFFLLARNTRLRLTTTLALVALLAIGMRFSPVLQLPITCVAYFFAGGGIYLLVHRELRWVLPVAIAMLASVLFCIWWLPLSPVQHYFALIAIWILVLTTLVALQPLFERSMLKKVFPVLGNLTYASYLIHFPLQLALVTVVATLGMGPELFLSPAVCAGYLLSVFLLSRGVYLYVEIPAQKYLRSRLLAHQETGTATPLS